jgi:putative tricarboxylic transport membrane protein
VKVNDALSGAALVALGAVVLWHIQGFPPMPGQKYGPAWFPGLIAIGLILCGALLVLARLRAADVQAPIEWPDWVRRPRAAAGVASILGGLLFYIFAVDALGFYLTAGFLLLLWMRLLRASWLLAVPVAIGATVVIHLSFYKLLKVPLPWGIFERFAF